MNKKKGHPKAASKYNHHDNAIVLRRCIDKRQAFQSQILQKDVISKKEARK
jgi:hypothetical protein